MSTLQYSDGETITPSEALELSQYLRSKEREEQMSDEHEVSPMGDKPPVELLSAIAKASAEIGKLAKENYNKHSNFAYASIDDFLAAVNPVLAKHGLVVWTDEVGCEMPTQAFNRFIYRHRFTIFHTSGQRMVTHDRTTVINNMGSQSSGAGQSYALKQFLRGLFLIATGDNDDPDAHPSQPTPARTTPQQVARTAAKKPTAKRPTGKQKEYLKKLVDQDGNFDHFWVFEKWIGEVKQKPLAEMNADEYSKVIEWLTDEKSEYVNWTDSMKEQLKSVNMDFMKTEEYSVMMGHETFGDKTDDQSERGDSSSEAAGDNPDDAKGGADAGPAGGSDSDA